MQDYGTRPLRMDQRAGRAVSAAQLERAFRLLEGVRNFDGKVRLTQSGLEFAAGTAVLASFDLIGQSGSTGAEVTISAGYVVFDGVGDYAVAETELTISGAPTVYIYVKAPWADFSSASITFASGSVRPSSDTSEFKRVLWELGYDATANYYGERIRRAGGQDVTLALASHHG